MKILYLDLGMGAAGDMLTAALLDAMDEKEKKEAIRQLTALNIPDVSFDVEKSIKCGITGTHVSVKVHGIDEGEGLHEDHHEHGHSHEHDAHHEHEHEHSHEHDDLYEHGHTHDHDDIQGHGHENEHSHEYDNLHEHEHGHSHEHDDHHEHDHSHTHDDIHEHEYEHTHDHDALHEHDHGHSHEHDDHHGHTHEHDALHEHSHDHDHTHDHGHSHEHHHSHASLEKINNIVDSLDIPDVIKSDVRSIYEIIARAEGHVHDKPITDIHFHEVGTMDAIADITAVCILIRRIGADKIIASPIHVGSGQVKCAHGILPVPAPATAFILKGIPMYSTHLRGELCTPTGAAILKYFVNEFKSMPAMTSENIGYGMGRKDFERANCVRAIIGHDINISERSAYNTDPDTAGSGSDTYKSSSDIYMPLDSVNSSDPSASFDQSKVNDSIIELRCNIDDMTGEEIGYAFEKLLEAGARDVFTTPITMKKNRPGILLTVICSVSDKDMMVKNIFKHTTTIGIRETVCNRYILNRESKTLNTPFGQVREKNVSGYGIQRSKLEYDDIVKIARNTGMSIREIKDSIKP